MNKILFVLVAFIMTSCITSSEVRYLQESENLVINEEGLVPYNVPEYRVTKNDILKLNIVTTPDGDAAQFYSTYNTTGARRAGNGGRGNNNNNNNLGNQGSFVNGGNGNFYFNGMRVNPEGDIRVFGIGLIKVVGRTLEDISAEIQERVNENFLEDKSEVRLNIDGITYYILGDIDGVEITGQKRAFANTLTITEALATNGGLNRTIDRTDITIIRKLPNGMKKGRIDLTREDTMNSEFFWVQNGDEIYLNTRKKNLNGFGKNPIQTLTTGVSVLATTMSIYLILSKL